MMRLKTATALLTVALLSQFAPVQIGYSQSTGPGAVGAGTQNLLYVNVKVWLEGPYNSGAMTTSLNPATLPTTQPYGGGDFTGTPMEYAGSEAVADWTGARASVVDWVLVELRTTTAAASAVATRAGLLMSDGSIKDTDGTSELIFTTPPGDHYIVVRHRNHIPIMSNAVVTLDATTPSTQYDMTVEANIYSGVGAGGAKEVDTGVFALFTGDANGSGGTGAEDQAIWLGENGFAGYLQSDYNLSAGAGAEDQALWLGNPSRLTLVPEN